MTITQAVLARRLKEAREGSRITQDQAAEALGLQRTAIVHIEAGNRSVSTIELAQLAKLYHRDISTFFAEDPVSSEEGALVALYRVDHDFRDNPEVKANVTRCIEICREGAQLEAILDLSRPSGPPAHTLVPPRSSAEAIRQGDLVAIEERKRISMGDTPIPDMADLISAQGVWVSGATLPDQMSGLFVHHAELGQVILVNFGHRRSRKRFSYAHEYGHCLMDRNQPISITTNGNQNTLNEVRANAFAATFLMPEGGVMAFFRAIGKGVPSRQTMHVYTPIVEESQDTMVEAQRRPVSGSQVITYQDVAQLAHHFGVSYKAAVYRLKNLSISSQAEMEALLGCEQHANNYRKLLRLSDETEGEMQDMPDRELVSQVAYLAVEAFRREEISRGRLLEISTKLNISGSKLVSLAKATTAGND